jgi:phosphoribosylamine--glycine ligase
VLCVSAFGKSFDEAREKAYRGLETISFTDSFYRKDIGLPGAAEST